jgi:hypothetical protein
MPLFVALFAAAGPLRAETALEVLRLLPAPWNSRVAAVHACDGAPEPALWHVLVYDPGRENRQREFVISGGRVTAVQEFSQFADRLVEADVFPLQAVAIDSPSALETARSVARANSVLATAFHFSLKLRDRRQPSWEVVLMDGDGDQLGTVTIDSKSGVLLQHSGFAFAPVTRPAEPPPAPPVASISAVPTTASVAREAAPPIPKAVPVSPPKNRVSGSVPPVPGTSYQPPNPRPKTAVPGGAPSTNRTEPTVVEPLPPKPRDATGRSSNFLQRVFGRGTPAGAESR